MLMARWLSIPLSIFGNISPRGPTHSLSHLLALCVLIFIHGRESPAILPMPHLHLRLTVRRSLEMGRGVKGPGWFLHAQNLLLSIHYM